MGLGLGVSVSVWRNLWRFRLALAVSNCCVPYRLRYGFVTGIVERGGLLEVDVDMLLDLDELSARFDAAVWRVSVGGSTTVIVVSGKVGGDPVGMGSSGWGGGCMSSGS